MSCCQSVGLPIRGICLLFVHQRCWWISIAAIFVDLYTHTTTVGTSLLPTQRSSATSTIPLPAVCYGKRSCCYTSCVPQPGSDSSQVCDIWQLWHHLARRDVASQQTPLALECACRCASAFVCVCRSDMWFLHCALRRPFHLVRIWHLYKRKAYKLALIFGRHFEVNDGWQNWFSGLRAWNMSVKTEVANKAGIRNN